MVPTTAVNAARGFLELGAPLKAWEMLEDLAPEERTHPDVFSCRLAILSVLGKWELGLELLRLLEPSPDAQPLRDCAGFCHLYACHLCGEGRIDEAKEYVAQASRLWPASLRESPCWLAAVNRGSDLHRGRFHGGSV